MKKYTTLLATLMLAFGPVCAQTPVPPITRPLPWDFDPLSMPSLPYKTVQTEDGYACIWVYQKDVKLFRYEVHCIKAVCNIPGMVETLWQFSKAPSETFWKNAKTSSCFDPKGYWPTAAERNLCIAVRKAWADWDLK